MAFPVFLYTYTVDVASPLVVLKMPVKSVIAAAMPSLHLFAYSTLLGTELYQSFVMTKLAYQALPRSAFTTLQKRVFPVYFQSQTLLLGLVALTLPTSAVSQTNLITFTVAGGTALMNLLVYGPRTQQLMIERIHQGMLPRIRFRSPPLTTHSNPRLKATHRYA
ncbi:hypothetical protein OPT61_g8381 [Boeremia exigua]|uniref:Uncharacterized protein n=1 Tax=Boeremia exigua TaxID=749465 RepID=A0ACC2HZE2_9PLEO|nr:hypothetical protein OPT61_g8381 [Boeremia exigua]